MAGVAFRGMLHRSVTACPLKCQQRFVDEAELIIGRRIERRGFGHALPRRA